MELRSMEGEKRQLDFKLNPQNLTMVGYALRSRLTQRIFENSVSRDLRIHNLNTELMSMHIITLSSTLVCDYILIVH
jgi:hypothetical protein